MSLRGFPGSDLIASPVLMFNFFPLTADGAVMGSRGCWQEVSHASGRSGNPSMGRGHSLFPGTTKIYFCWGHKRRGGGVTLECT